MTSTPTTGARTVVYTDGACSGNPGPGGWGWVVPDGPFGNGGDPATTNQRMELAAVLNAVRSLPGPIHIVSDSTYVVNCFRDNWWKGWLKRGWKNSQKKPVANRDIWEPLIELYQERDLTFEWVKGHSGNKWNDRADELAVAAVPSAAEVLQAAKDAPAVDEFAGEPNLFSAAPMSDDVAVEAHPRRIVVGGLRPPELGGYDENAISTAVRRRLVDVLRAKAEMFPDLMVLTGLQLGAEQLGAEAAAAAGVAYTAVLAFPDPAARWPKESRARFDGLLDGAVDVQVLSAAVPSAPQEVAKAFAARDRWLQAHADEAVLVWDRDHAGVGTSVRSFEKMLGDDVWIIEPKDC